MGRHKEERLLSEADRNKLFDKYVTININLVRKTVVDYTLNPSDVEDNLQESLINLLEYIHTYDPEMSIQTWIITCTIRFVGKLEAKKGLNTKNIDQYRKSYLEKYAPKGLLKMQYIEETIKVLKIQDDAIGFDEKKFSDEVEKAILTIKPTYSRAFLIKHLWGWSLDEIANLEGINKSMAKHRVHMAKVELSKALEEYARTRD